MPDQPIFKGNAEPHKLGKRPPAPSWRNFAPPKYKEKAPHRGQGYHARPAEIEAVNAALLLRRPLLITGKAGTGKSTLAHAIAYELQLGDALVWPITSRSTLQQGLYQYDAVARLQASADIKDTGKYLRLGPLGTALATSTEEKPRVLLIDEIDKSDIDLPNDLLHVFETGEFSIPELERLPKGTAYDKIKVATPDRDEDNNPIEEKITRGRVRCEAFPIIVLTSNGEREFAPAFLRRCLQVNIEPPNDAELTTIIWNRLKVAPGDDKVTKLIELFKEPGQGKEVATDQLLNAVYLVSQGFYKLDDEGKAALRKTVLRSLGTGT